MIKVTYDSEVDAKYVSIREGKVSETKTINDWLFFDVDDKGGVLGVEILDSSKRLLSLTTLGNELTELSFPNNNVVVPLNAIKENGEQYVASTEAILA